MGVGELSMLIVTRHHTSFPVVDDVGRLIGTVGVEQLRDAQPDMPVWQVMSTRVQTIPEHAGALDAFRLMGRFDCPRLIAVDPAGRMTGIVSDADLARAIQVRMMGFQVVNPTPAQVQRAGAGFSPSPSGLGFGYTHADVPRDPQRYARPL